MGAKESQSNSKVNSNNKFRELKSDFFLKLLLNFIPKIKSLQLVKYNKHMQKRIDININNYKEYSEIYSSIEIEIIPIKDKYGNFIKIKEEDKKYYHIYFNNNKEEEIKRTNLNEDDKVSKINIIINYQIKSFKELFQYCQCIETINFTKFYRTNITDMSFMFNGCSAKEINLTNFNTNNATDLSWMFGSTLLKEINLTNFNTNNVTDMSYMFNGCSALKELNLANFQTDKVTNMKWMFNYCSSLTELNLTNFEINEANDMRWMFNGCSDELKLKIKNQNKNIKDEAFYLE